MTFENTHGIAWDLDGTLLDSFGIFEEVLLDCIKGTEYPTPTQQEMLKNYHGSLQETIGNILAIKDITTVKALEASFLLKQADYYDGDLHSHLYQDAAILAQQAAAQRIPQALITNRSHEGRGAASPHHIVANTVLSTCIQTVYAGDQIAYRKPDKRCLSDWMEQQKIAPHELLVVGDQFVDAQLALNIGARALLVERNGQIPHMEELVGHPDITITSTLRGIELA